MSVFFGALATGIHALTAGSGAPAGGEQDHHRPETLRLMLDSSLRRLARTIDAYPRRIAIACLIAAVLAAAAVARIPVTTDLLDVMPDQAPAIVAFTDFLRDFGILGGLVIVVETGSDSPESLLAVVQTIGEQVVRFSARRVGGLQPASLGLPVSSRSISRYISTPAGLRGSRNA